MALAAGETLVALTAGETPAYQPIQSAAVPHPLVSEGDDWYAGVPPAAKAFVGLSKVPKGR